MSKRRRLNGCTSRSPSGLSELVTITLANRTWFAT